MSSSPRTPEKEKFIRMERLSYMKVGHHRKAIISPLELAYIEV
jgi:hypothetical protein